MEQVFIFLAPGFEEIEAVSIIDVLRRAGIHAQTVSISDKREVAGAHNISITADSLFNDTDFSNGTMLILPGGMPGTTNLKNHAALSELILSYYKNKKLLSAICAAPLVYGNMGLLNGEKAIAYPGFENELKGAEIPQENVVQSGVFITGKGPGTAIEFALKIVERLKGKELAEELANALIFKK